MNIYVSLKRTYNKKIWREDWDMIMKPEDLNDVYKTIAEELSVEVAEKIFSLFSGTQVVFPVKFTTAEFRKQQVIEMAREKKKIAEIAKDCGMTDRRVRQIIKNKESK